MGRNANRPPTKGQNKPQTDSHERETEDESTSGRTERKDEDHRGVRPKIPRRNGNRNKEVDRDSEEEGSEEYDEDVDESGLTGPNHITTHRGNDPKGGMRGQERNNEGVDEFADESDLSQPDERKFPPKSRLQHEKEHEKVNQGEVRENGDRFNPDGPKKGALTRANEAKNGEENENEKLSPEDLGRKVLQDPKDLGLEHVKLDGFEGDKSQLPKRLGQAIKNEMSFVEEEIHLATQRANPDSKEFIRRAGLFIQDETIQEAFALALKEANKHENKFFNGLFKTGTVALKILCAVGGVGLILSGAYLSIVMLDGKPVEVAAKLASVMYRGAEKLKDKVDKRLEEKKLNTESARQLLKLVPSGFKGITPEMLKEFENFKLAVATRLATGTAQSLKK